MTCVAYKGGQLASDKQSTWSNLGWRTKKIRRLADGSLIAATGASGMCRELVQWYVDGAVAEKFPDRKGECHLLVITRAGIILLFDSSPAAVQIEEDFIALGSGRDYAIAAMDLGCTAQEAVELACKYDTTCGRGVDVLELDEADAA